MLNSFTAAWQIDGYQDYNSMRNNGEITHLSIGSW